MIDMTLSELLSGIDEEPDAIALPPAPIGGGYLAISTTVIVAKPFVLGNNGDQASPSDESIVSKDGAETEKPE